MTTFLFLRVTHDPSGCPESGDSRRAAHSSVRSDPGAGSSCLRRFARPRYRSDRPTSKCLRTASRVGIDVHGSLERAKDVSSPWRRGLRAFHVECVRLAYADDVPLLVVPEGTTCRRCDRLPGNEPHGSRVGPTKIHVLPPTREG